MNPDDFKKADLELLGYTGTVQDMEMAWLYDQGATTGNIKDRWKTYLTGLGYSGSLNDMFVAWLTAKGYSGPLNDLIREALAADNFYGVAVLDALLLETGDTLLLENGDRLLLE